MRLPGLRFAALASLALAALPFGCGPTAPATLPPPVPRDASVALPPDAASVLPDAGEDASVDAGAIDAAVLPPDASIPDDAGPVPDDAALPDDAATEPPDADTFWTRVANDGGTDASFPACFGTAWPLEGETHVPEPQQVLYRHNPPSSGNHWPCWAPWTTATKVLPRERFVHNLEHGGVVLLYRCPEPDAGFPAGAFADGGSPCPTEAAAVQSFLATAPAAPAGDKRYLVTAISDMPHTFAAVSWGFTLERDTLDPAEFTCFAVAHLGQAPEDFGGNPDPTGCAQSYPP